MAVKIVKLWNKYIKVATKSSNCNEKDSLFFFCFESATIKKGNWQINSTETKYVELKYHHKSKFSFLYFSPFFQAFYVFFWIHLHRGLFRFAVVLAKLYLYERF